MIRLHEPTFGNDEIAAAVDVMRSTMVTQGAKVKAFEDAYAGMFGHRHAVACNSGSSANLLAIAALVATSQLCPGDGVIVSALSWSTTIAPLIQHGLVPVFVDCDETLNMDVKALKRAAALPFVTAVMPVHVYGVPCDMNNIAQICAAEELFLIEDCCEAMGATYAGSSVGSFGDMGTFSFYFSHHITTLEGGMVVTDSATLAEKLRILRAHGWTRDTVDPGKYSAGYEHFDPRFLFVEAGYNLRMTDVQAAIGLVQLPKLKGFLDQRRSNDAAYREWLGKKSIQALNPLGVTAAFGFPVLGLDRQATAKRLADVGVESRPVIAGNMAAHPMMKKHNHKVDGDLTNANRVMHTGLALPNHQAMNEADIERVCEALCRR